MDELPILVIDPGADKCGVAVLTESSVLDHRVVPTAELVSLITSLLPKYRFEVVAIGDGTGSGHVRTLVMRKFPTVAVVPVDETETTLEARRLYFADHPPQGWRRLIPRSLQMPDAPYDDYAAIAMGRRYLKSGSPVKLQKTSMGEKE